MSYIGKNPKADTLNLTPQSALPTTPSEGMLWRSDGTVRGVGLFEYKSGNWIQVDEQLGDSDTLDLQTADGCNLTYNANWYSSGSLNIQGRSDTWGAEREDLSGTGTNDFITLSTTAADLLNSNGVSVIKFAPTDTTAGRNAYFGKRMDLQQGWRGSNLVVEFRYKTAETSGDTTGTDWLFVARDASLPILEISAQGTNTLDAGTVANVYAEDGTTSVYQTPAVGDSILLTDTSNNTYLRYITALSGTLAAGSTNMVVTYSGTDLTLPTGTTVNATAVLGIFTSLTQYLPASDDQGSSYKAQVKTDTDTKTIEYGIMHISTQTDQQIYVDNLLLSANKFLQASSQTKIESYLYTYQDLLWQTSGTTAQWDEAKLVPQGGSPTLAQSKLISISDITGPGTVGTATIIKAKQPISLIVSASGYISMGGTMTIEDADGYALSGNQQPDGVGGVANQKDVTASVNLNKDEYVYARKMSGTNQYGSMAITATPQTSPVILLESQDEIFTDWVDWTPSFDTASWAAGGANDVKIAKWRRVGSDMEVALTFQLASSGTISTDVAYIPLPTGYSIDLTKCRVSGTDNGTIVGTYGRVNSGYGMPYNASYVGFVVPKSDGKLFITYGPDSDTNLQTYTIASIFGANESLVINYKVPIQGWNANFNPLLSMPLVNVGNDMEEFQAWQMATPGTQFGAIGWDEIQKNTTGSLLSLANPSTGLVATAQQRCLVHVSFVVSATVAVWNFVVKNGTPGNDPSTFSYGTTIQSQSANTGGGGEAQNVKGVFILEPGDTVYVCSGGTSFYDTNYRSNISMVAVRDRGNTNMAHIIKPAICHFSETQGNGTAGGNSGTNDYQLLYPNTFQGETWFISAYNGTLGVAGTNSQFTLEPGMYKIEVVTPFYKTNSSRASIKNVTDGVYYDGQNQYAASGEDSVHNSKAIAIFTITAAKAFAIYTWTSNSQSSNGLGKDISQGVEQFLQGTITKYK